MQDSQQIADSIRERLSSINDESTRLATALDALTPPRRYTVDETRTNGAPKKRGRPRGSRNGTRAKTKAAA